MDRFQAFTSTELQHLVAALARSPLAENPVTQALTDQASDELDRRLENSANTIRYNVAA